MTVAEQRQSALVSANAIRSARAQYARALQAMGSRREAWRLAAMILKDLPPELRTARVEWLLRKCYKTGPRDTNRVLCRYQINGATSLGDLSGRQRERLLEVLRRGKL